MTRNPDFTSTPSG